MSPDNKEDGVPHPMGTPSPKDVRESEDSVVHPLPTAVQYIPDLDGETGERWAKLPTSALGLPKPQLRVLFAYSRCANRFRVATVSENTIATDLGWFYGKNKTPNRRNVIRERDALVAGRFMEDAGVRRVPGADKVWVRSYLVAPYNDQQYLDVLSRRALTGGDNPSTMRRFRRDDASVSPATMRPSATHIQRSTEDRTEHSSASPRLRGSRPRKAPTPRAKREYETTDVIEERRRRALQALASYQEQERTEEQSV